MTTPTGDVDWAEAERGQRRLDLLAAPVLVAFLAGIVLLTGGFGLWTGGSAWVAVGSVLALAGMAAAAQSGPRARARRSAAYRVQVALRSHVDPGPAVRARVDGQARYLVEVRWAGWCLLLGPLGLLVAGQWDRRPVLAAVGAVLVVGVAAGYTRWWWVRVADARRWLADPPGPAREAPPPTTAERWLTGRRALLLFPGLLLLVLLLGLAVALASGS
ncbi:hypothetical protein ACI789_03360 [Geodermatophilus sp. SYSU D00965]